MLNKISCETGTLIYYKIRNCVKGLCLLHCCFTDCKSAFTFCFDKKWLSFQRKAEKESFEVSSNAFNPLNCFPATRSGLSNHFDSSPQLAVACQTTLILFPATRSGSSNHFDSFPQLAVACQITLILPRNSRELVKPLWFFPATRGSLSNHFDSSPQLAGACQTTLTGCSFLKIGCFF